MKLRICTVLGVVSLFALACSDSITEKSVAENRPPRDLVPFEYPSGPDRYESDGSPETAGAIGVGTPQWHSLYPVGDEDWVRVALDAGVEYEFSSSHLSVNGDTWLWLYDTDGATVLADNDDCIGYDSCFQFTPSSDGVYYLRVEAYADQGLMSYRLEVRPFADADGDGWSAFYDCDEAEPLIHPKAVDTAGDGTDRNCTAGMDAPVATVADAFENGDDRADTGSSPVEPLGSQYEFTLRPEYFPGAIHTLDYAGDVDWFKVDVPPHQMVLFEVLSQGWPFSDQYNSGISRADIPDMPAGVRYQSSFDGYLTIANDSETQTTVDVRVTIDPNRSQPPFSYLAYVAPKGYDRDMDGYGTMGMWNEHDCDDDDPTINDGALDTAGDGIDQDCDGVDGAAPRVMLRDGFANKRRK